MFSLKLITEKKKADGYGYGRYGAALTVVWAELRILGIVCWRSGALRFVGDPVRE